MKAPLPPLHDIRFACTTVPGGPLVVDLSFYDVDWYDQMTDGIEAASCFHAGPGGSAVSPARRNNLTGQVLPVGDGYDSGALAGEDSCGDPNDFTVDFDDRGMNSNQVDGTDWGSDDGSIKCGAAGNGHSFFVLVR